MRARPGPTLRLLPWFLAVAAFAPVSSAKICTLDAVPAATLLLPNFELDLTPGATDDVIVTLNNAAGEAGLVRVTLWTDWALSTYQFELYLTGYDVQTFRLRDLFDNRNIPITADLQSDPGNTISPSPQPERESSFPNCQNVFPFYVNPVISAANQERLRDGHTGKPISLLLNRCLGRDHGDLVARGYITFDSVSSCATSWVGSPGYFAAGGTGVANNRNILWGDYLSYRPGAADLEAQPMVHLEADASLPGPTGYTFYSSLPSARDGRDNREPLGTVWGAAYWSRQPPLIPEQIDAGTDIVVWRDPTAGFFAVQESYGCGVGANGPSWSPLPQNSIYCFDEQENLVEACRGERCFPLATQRLAAGDGFSPFERGWCRYDLGLADEGPVLADADYPGGIAQSYLTTAVRYSTYGTAGLPAVLLRSACQGVLPTDLERILFLDGFESGSTAAWSQVVP